MSYRTRVSREESATACSVSEQHAADTYAAVHYPIDEASAIVSTMSKRRLLGLTSDEHTGERRSYVKDTSAQEERALNHKVVETNTNGTENKKISSHRLHAQTHESRRFIHVRLSAARLLAGVRPPLSFDSNR